MTRVPAGAVAALLGGLCLAETDAVRRVISHARRERINHPDERMTG
jgi:hypothetical protein